MSGLRTLQGIVIVFFFFTCSAVTADDIFSLGEIVVSGETPRVVESVGTIDVVTADDIQRSGARTLDEAVKLLPGIYIFTGGDGTPRINIRGMRTRQVILLLDGVPINSAIDGQFDPSAIDVANIERIKVTRGTSSLLYGTGGTAGVINIITKAGSRNFSGSALVGFGNNGQKRGQINAGGGVQDWKMFVSASGYHRDSFILSDDYDPVPVTGAPNPNNFQPAGDRINSDRTDKNLYANLVWQGLPRTELGLSAGYRNGYFGKPGEVRDFTGADADPFARRPRFEREDDFEGYSLNLTAKHEFLVPLTVRPMLYFNRLDELTNNYDNADFNTQDLNRSFSQKTRSDIFGGDLQVNYNFGGFGHSSFAVNCRHENWHDSGFQRGGNKNNIELILINADDDICSAALEHELHFMDKIGLVGSLGYAWQERSSGNHEDGVNYLLGAYYDLFANTRLHINHSRQVRFPTLRDLYEPGRANPDLKPERTKQYEAGIEYSFSHIPANIVLTVFRTDAENFIEVPLGGGMVQNFEHDRFEGIEINGGVLLFGSLNVRAAYTMLESRNLSDGVTNHDLQNRPHDQISAQAGYRIPWVGIDVYASLLHSGGNLELARQSPASRATGDYDVVNFKAEKWIGKAGIYGQVSNLFDEDYAESGGFPAPGRMVLIGGELNFGL